MVLATNALGALVEINDRSGEVKFGQVVDVFVASSLMQTPGGVVVIQALHYSILLQNRKIVCMLAADQTLTVKALDRDREQTIRPM